MILSTKHYRKIKNGNKQLGSYKPFVTIIVPCFNEELTLENCVTSLLKQSYKMKEIIIVNDGSTDKTRSVAGKIAKRNPDVVRVFSKENGGKASALNYGLAKAAGEIVVCIDADSVFLKDTVRQLVLSFRERGVVAVGGNVRVANRRKLLTKLQAVEYITGLNLQRRAFAYLNCMQVISGAIGAFRKDKLVDIGGYSRDSIVEDMDVTVSLARTEGKVVYNSRAIAYTEAPENIRDFIKQRYRWTFGGLEVLRKHRDLIFNPKYKSLGLIGVPYFMIFPWVDVLVSFLFFQAVIRAFMLGNFTELFLFYPVMAAIQGILIYYSISLDGESKKLIFMAGLDSLWYNHIISFVTLKAGLNFVWGKKTAWNKIERVGANVIRLAGA